MKQLIDINTWERAATFRFFKDAQDPTCSITTEIDCTEAFSICKTHSTSFFKLTTYAALKAVNQIKELRYSIENNGEQPVMHNVVNLLTPIRKKESTDFVQIYIEYAENFEEFCRIAANRIAAAESKTDSFEDELSTEYQGGLLCLSCLPELYFTSATTALVSAKEYPLNIVTVGKAIERGDKRIMPVAIRWHHGLCDGYHITQFFKQLETIMRETAQTITITTHNKQS